MEESQSQQGEGEPEVLDESKEEFMKLTNGYLKMEQMKKLFTPKTFLQKVMDSQQELAISPGVLVPNFNFQSPFPKERGTKVINDSNVNETDPASSQPQDNSVLDLAYLWEPDSEEEKNNNGALGDDQEAVVPRSKPKFRYAGNVATLQHNLVASSFKDSTQQKAVSFSNRSGGYHQVYFSSELRSLRGKVQRLNTRLDKKKKMIRQLRHQTNLLSFGFSAVNEGEVKTMKDVINESVDAPVFISETACTRSLDTVAQKSSSPGSLGLPTKRNKFKRQSPTLSCGCLCFCSEKEKRIVSEGDSSDLARFPTLEDRRWTVLSQKYKTQLTNIFPTKSSETDKENKAPDKDPVEKPSKDTFGQFYAGNKAITTSYSQGKTLVATCSPNSMKKDSQVRPHSDSQAKPKSKRDPRMKALGRLIFSDLRNKDNIPNEPPNSATSKVIPAVVKRPSVPLFNQDSGSWDKRQGSRIKP